MDVMGFADEEEENKNNENNENTFAKLIVVG